MSRSQSYFLLTVWFSTLSDSLAETQTRYTANNLRTLKSDVVSKKLLIDGDGTKKILPTPSLQLRKGDPDFTRKR